MKTTNQANTKHVPIRTCIVSREAFPKKELIRMALVDDELVVDKSGKMRGRGANIKPDVALFDIAIKKNILKNALKIKKPISTEQIEKLRVDFVDAIEERQFRPTNKPVKIRIHKDKLPTK